ncbi:MAG: hypothetical protein PHX70_13900 [Clostridium sp.]|nr:hypothetical protein [Clostridium sp.]
MLNIYIEDKQHDGASINYVVDENSGISSRVKIPGFKVTNFKEVVKPHEYKSTFSSPSSNAANRVFSQYALAVSINRGDFGFYLKIFLPFLLSVSLGLIVLRLKSDLIDARTGLAGAAFFGVVANAYVVSTFIPSDGGAFGILDILNFISLLSVLLIVAVSILSHKLCIDGEETEFTKALDKTVFYSIIIGYSILSVVLPFCTYLQS